MTEREKERQLFGNPAFRELMAKEKGTTCVNCESSHLIEYHHIVPVVNGGRTILSNIVPLCQPCHYAAHDRSYKHIGPRPGRPTKYSYEKALPHLRAFYNLEIGTAECKKLIGLTPKNKNNWYALRERYERENDVPKDFKNTLDVQESWEKRQLCRKDKFKA